MSAAGRVAGRHGKSDPGEMDRTLSATSSRAGVPGNWRPVRLLGRQREPAPVWLRGLGHEWLWRLVQEPRLKARRYLLGNPLFLARVLSELSGSGRFKRHSG